MLLNAWRWFYARSALGPLRWALIISTVSFTGGQIRMLCDDWHFHAQVFQGQLTYTIKCPEGHTINEETNPFWTLPLSLRDTQDSIFSVVSRQISAFCRLRFQYGELLWIGGKVDGKRYADKVKSKQHIGDYWYWWFVLYFFCCVIFSSLKNITAPKLEEKMLLVVVS